MRSVIAAALGALLVAGCADRDPPASRPSASLTATPELASAAPGASPSGGTESPGPDAGEARLVAAGDIAACDVEGDSLTAALIESLGEDHTVATLGDNV